MRQLEKVVVRVLQEIRFCRGRDICLHLLVWEKERADGMLRLECLLSLIVESLLDVSFLI